MSKNKSSVRRTRNYATVVYPDSAPNNWLELLENQVIPAFVSPLHNMDINPTGEDKKEHYHVMLMYDNVKTVEQAKEVFDIIGGVGCEPIQSSRGYARYLCHLDNPEKYQYPAEEVKCLAGADYFDVIGLPVDKYNAINEMIEYCISNNIYEYCDLLNYARCERYDWFRCLCDNCTIVMREFLISRRLKRKVSAEEEQKRA